MTFHRQTYTKEQDELILAHPGPAIELAAQFGISLRALYSRRTLLKSYKLMPKQKEFSPVLSAKDLVTPTFARPSWFNEDTLAIATGRR